jgi:hypothetical protein
MTKEERYKILDAFGEIVTKNVRDRVFKEFLWDLEGASPDKSSLKQHHVLKKFSPEEQGQIKNIVLDTIDATIHYFFWMIEQHNLPPIEMDLTWKTSEEQLSLRDLSDGLYGEAYGEEGWTAQFSDYPQAFPEEEPK